MRKLKTEYARPGVKTSHRDGGRMTSPINLDAPKLR